MSPTRKLAALLSMCGVGLLVYGLLSFQAGSEAPIVPSAFTQVGWEISYGVNARLEATIGAVLLTAGCLLLKRR
jgi:hypothetical protein